MAKKLLLTFLSCVMLLTASVALAACSKTIPEYTGDPISVKGTFRWADDDWIYLDLTITNNTNVEIKNARLDSTVNYIFEDGSSGIGQEGQGNLSSLTASKKGIKPQQDFTCTIKVTKYHDDDRPNPRGQVVACEYTLSFTQLTFKNYGDMPLETLLALTVEGHK